MQEKIEIKQLLENPEYFDYITWMQTVRRELENMSDRATIIVMASILDTVPSSIATLQSNDLSIQPKFYFLTLCCEETMEACIIA